MMQGIQESLLDLQNNALRVNIITGASNQGTGNAAASPWSVSGNISIQGQQVSGAGVNTNPLLIGGVDGATAHFALVDSAGRQIVVGKYTFTNLATSGTSTIKSGAGILHSVTVNKKGTGTTLTLYDSLTGTGTTIGTIDTTLGQETLVYDAAFSTGLTAVASNGSGLPDLTITWV